MRIKTGVFAIAAFLVAAMTVPARADADCCKAKPGAEAEQDCCKKMKEGAGAAHEGHGDAKAEAGHEGHGDAKAKDAPGGKHGKHGKGKKMKMGHRPPGPPPPPPPGLGPHGDHDGPPPPPPSGGPHGDHAGPPRGGPDGAHAMLHREMQELRRALHKAIDDAFKQSLDSWKEARPRFEEGRRELHRKMEKGRERMGEARERAEKFREWMEQETGRAPEKMREFREEAEKRFEGFGRHLRDRIEESGKRAPEEMKEFRERLEKRMEEIGKRFHRRHDEADAKGAERPQREFHLKLRGPDGETHEWHGGPPGPPPGGPHGDGFGKLRQGAEDFALKFLQTPQGADLARQSMGFMREAGARITRRMEELQGENNAMKGKLEELQRRLGEIEKAGK